MAESILDDGVQGYVVLFGEACGALVQVNGNTHIEAALVWLVGRFTALFAEGEIFIDRITEVAFEFANALAAVADHVPESKHAAVKHFIFGAVFD